MNILKQRIANIVSPRTDELALKRDAKFGKLNVERMPFRITSRHNAAPYRILEELRVERIEARGSMDAVDAAIAAQRAAGLREPVAAIVGGA